MIWSYRPYKNPEARKRYLKYLSLLYILSILLIIHRYSQIGLERDFVIPSLALLLTVTFFSLLMLRKPRYCYTDVNHIYISGKKIKKDEVEYEPFFDELKVELSGKTRKTLYFERKEDLIKFLKDVGFQLDK